ncbi:hypothetical protein BFF78_02355 [Streptomyces fodineus]|uniref:Uncharacterized protein n=1 Tax=Streptomyces fodineus TaxID=1904616 RepID=A0A1D7Y3D4_9ACTN|nr:hypothetical protein [Streptomyces fodineus]AOR30066.1 hypothetical protein BFF78_02355 [Streptomyces fodineus]
MTEDVVLWNRLAALLPEAEAQEIRDCWDIGEQEAGLGLLVSGILDHEVPISETVRARISVLAESWGEREVLTPRILRCHGNDAPARLKLIDHGVRTDDVPADGPDPEETGLVRVPWIACTRCGQILMRVHARESWGDLSCLAEHYVIPSPDHSTARRRFPAGSADAAFDALLNECPQPVAGQLGVRGRRVGGRDRS